MRWQFHQHMEHTSLSKKRRRQALPYREPRARWTGRWHGPQASGSLIPTTPALARWPVGAATGRCGVAPERGSFTDRGRGGTLRLGGEGTNREGDFGRWMTFTEVIAPKRSGGSRGRVAGATPQRETDALAGRVRGGDKDGWDGPPGESQRSAVPASPRPGSLFRT